MINYIYVIMQIKCNHLRPHKKSIGCIEDKCYVILKQVKCIQIFDDFITEEEFKI